ncbi:MAG: hypothetical protein QF464_03790 [Myxococcota bacterium]|jgi:hypothetical protein|nr:hypothetical protein [Myxococcota bacterium]
MAIVTLQARKGVADLLGSNASPATLGTSYAAGGTSSAANPDGADWMAFYVYVDAKSTAGRLDFQVEVSPSGDTAVATDWAPLQGETYATGTATLDPWEGQTTAIAAVVTDPTLVAVIPFRTKGLRYWRIKLKADAGTPTVHVRFGCA